MNGYIDCPSCGEMPEAEQCPDRLWRFSCDCYEDDPRPVGKHRFDFEDWNDEQCDRIAELWETDREFLKRLIQLGEWITDNPEVNRYHDLYRALNECRSLLSDAFLEFRESKKGSSNG